MHPIQTRTVLPLEVGNRTPGAKFTKLPIPCNEGTHTGGPYLSPNGLEVWKPLDGISHLTTVIGRIPTQEAIVLEYMADKPGFPRNWRVELANDRLWLVRAKCGVVGQDLPVTSLSLSQILYIEQAVRLLNANHWEVNDRLSIAIDPSTNTPFILDLSAACQVGVHPESRQANDCIWLAKWLETLEATSLIKLRCEAKQLLNSREWRDARYDSRYTWVYRLALPALCSTAITDAKSWDQAMAAANHTEGMIWNYKDHLWVIAPNAIDPDKVESFNLEWGWSPIVYAENA